LGKALNLFAAKQASVLGVSLDDAESHRLDEKPTVIFAAARPNNVGRSVNETLRIVRPYRGGRLCPADWEPGDSFGPAD